MKREPIRLFVALVAALVSASAGAFDPPTDTAGPVTASIAGPAEVTQAGTAVPVHVDLKNAGAAALSGTVELGVIDDWRVEPAGPVPFQVEANASTALPFSVTPGPGTHPAHYPIHASVRFEHEGQALVAHPVRLVEARLAGPSRTSPAVAWQPLALRPGAEAPLWRMPVFRVVLAPADGGPGRALPPGRQGVDEETRGSVYLGAEIDRGGTRETVAIHPPWQGDRYRSELVEFPVGLPDAAQVVLRFANAIRDHVPDREPPSDGVTFRVRVAPFDAPDGALGELLFDRHTDAKLWQDAEVDLSRYAGKAVRVQLESHPGPQLHTACDQSYWAEPTLVVGSPGTTHATTLPARTLGTIERGGRRCTVTVTPGARGLLDATVAFAPDGLPELSFRGFPLRVLGDDLSDARSLANAVEIREEGGRNESHYHARHRFEGWAGRFDVAVELWLGREALQARFRLENAPAPQPWQAFYIEDLSAGPWNRTAQRVYAGVGNVIEEPQAFRLGFDGHQLSTSFVGFEFGEGLSLVQAVDLPPTSLEAVPQAKEYSLHVAHNATLTFIPAANVWEGARAWHDINGLEPAGGVRGLAGRFVFDLWGGRYGETADALQRAFAYGLVDSAVVWHNWQRWGYDYRLPDIYPPNPRFGTMEEFRRLVDACKANGVVFAPHDNYIDFYPDAEGYSYDKVAFQADGRPMRGWLNEGRGAQAYRWRVDLLQPVIARNLALIRDGFQPTGYFIDVWSSAAPHDYWTRDGRFFDRVFTRNTWAQHFAWIRQHLGNDAPQISESGHDQLIGFLDGAQTNHLRVRRPGEPETWLAWRIDCRDAERVPWLDAAHHDRFVLHGAGYESRYAGDLDPREHGIYSDDYICSEVLTGHPAMVPAPFGRDVVRKYWLLHDLMRGLALQRIENVQFAGNIHRQHVRWEGAETWVNRGNDDWTVEGRVLPPYGFYARGPAGAPVYEAAIERRDGVLAEWASSPAGVYANARPVPELGVRVSTPAEAVRYLGDRRFELTLDWEAQAPLEKAYRVFVHFLDSEGKIRFQADYDPAQPATEWRGARRDTITVRIPAEVKPSELFELRVGMYEPGSHAPRPRLDGWNDGTGAVRLGRLSVEGSEGSVSGVAWSPLGESPHLARMNPEGKPLSLGAVTTDGACRLSKDGEALRVTPLPESRAFRVRVRWDALPWDLPEPARIETLDESGRVLDQTGTRLLDGAVEWECKPGIFAYRLSAQP